MMFAPKKGKEKASIKQLELIRQSASKQLQLWFN